MILNVNTVCFFLENKIVISRENSLKSNINYCRGLLSWDDEIVIPRKKLLIDNTKCYLSLFFYNKTVTPKKELLEYNTKYCHILFLYKDKIINHYALFYYILIQCH